MLKSELTRSRLRLRRNSLIFAAVLIGIVVFVAGLAASPLLFPSQRSSVSEGLPIGGYFYVNAFHSDGNLFASWQGHNSLYSLGLNALAECLSGQHLPSVLGTCTGFTSAITAEDVSFHHWDASAKNTLYPSGCDPTANPGTCTGWQAKALINFSSGTFPTSITRIDGEVSYGYPFDLVGISPITVNMGDYLTVTITYTIS